MARATRLALAALAASVAGSASTSARAESPNAKATPVYVLPLSTDDADDQADALTQALRSRVRQAAGWSLLETSQSFETLAIALKCPPKPDPLCLQRIGDQLHADHYVWGTLAKKRSASEVTADLHLWSRGKTDADASETYSDNLKDASDEALRGVAARLFGRMSGAGTGGTLIVHAGRSAGTVVVDGADRGALDNGIARLELPAGSHTIAVRVPGVEAPPGQTAEVASGSEQELNFVLAPVRMSAQPEEPSSPVPVGKVLGYSAIVAGAGFLVAGGIEAANWVNDNSASTEDRNRVPKSVADVCTQQSAAAIDACNKSKDALTVSTLGWIFGGAGALLLGTGIVLVVSDHGSSSDGRHTASVRPIQGARVDVVPALGPHAGSLDVRVRF
jgi:hypothetical protein